MTCTASLPLLLACKHVLWLRFIHLNDSFYINRNNFTSISINHTQNIFILIPLPLLMYRRFKEEPSHRITK